MPRLRQPPTDSGDRREVDVNAFTGERREVDYNAFTGETTVIERDAFGDTFVQSNF